MFFHLKKCKYIIIEISVEKEINFQIICREINQNYRKK